MWNENYLCWETSLLMKINYKRTIHSSKRIPSISYTLKLYKDSDCNKNIRTRIYVKRFDHVQVRHLDRFFWSWKLHYLQNLNILYPCYINKQKSNSSERKCKINATIICHKYWISHVWNDISANIDWLYE